MGGAVTLKSDQPPGRDDGDAPLLGCHPPVTALVRCLANGLGNGAVHVPRAGTYRNRASGKSIYSVAHVGIFVMIGDKARVRRGQRGEGCSGIYIQC